MTGTVIKALRSLQTLPRTEALAHSSTNQSINGLKVHKKAKVIINFKLKLLNL